MVKTKPIYVRVSEHVEAEGWTAVDLAKRVGWHPMKAQRVLRGATSLLAEDMELIAKVLKKPVAELFSSPVHKTS
jgi:transcriptional regulator with XRE-family HTH domain